MSDPFDYFVVFAEMRTGSNFLETNLNAFDGVACYGEAFNPHFIGYPNRTEILGVTQATRDGDPVRLIETIKSGADAIGGFRYFHDHDPRVLDIALADRRCAKIILTRNPLDSYVSWKIAQATGQWKLTDVNRRKDAAAVFDGDEFSAHVTAVQAFQVDLLNRLQTSGQTAFYVAYEDLQNVDVMNGLARWLGVKDQLAGLDKSLKRQNPSPVTDKVANPDDMIAAVADLDQFNLTRTPNFEPRRGAAVPSYMTAAETPLLYLPIKGGPESEVVQWMAALDGVDVQALGAKMNQKSLRQWKRKHPGHRSFTVLRHPAERAHACFCERILSTGPGSFAKIRATLRQKFKIPLPEKEPDESYTLATHRSAFDAFLDFLAANLVGQTAIRVDAAWGSQSQALNSFTDFTLPDHVFREDELHMMLPELARQVGHSDPPAVPKAKADAPYALADIYDDQLEARISDVYQRDYMMFGFRPWSTYQTAG